MVGHAGPSEAGVLPAAHEEAHGHGSLAALSLAALGIVYGDIGTSPLYAMRECFHGPHAVAAGVGNVLGVLSLIVWSLILVVTVKYLVYVLRADYGGEGGILALTALAVPGHAKAQPSRFRRALVLIGLFGAALLYGDGVLTPAISVLSATEGLKVVAPSLERFVVPMTIVILFGLFWFQHRGTRGVGSVFGPVTIVWFLTLAALGVSQVMQEPRVLAAVSPGYAAQFFMHNGKAGFIVLGSVFLVVTGAEAIYADLGHFGKRPIRLTWFGLVLPCLLIHYFGQGALVLREPSAVPDLFFRMAPEWAVVPLVILSTVATVIASQAVISGAFSLSRQAVMMGYLPRLKIEHTSAREIGQIYIPSVNWALMLATIAMVLSFGSSSSLAAAYGIAVTSTMAITTILAYQVTHRRWKWPLGLSIGVTAVFLVADFSFLGANLFKIADGGWVPLAMGAVVLVLMTTWKRGRTLLANRTSQRTIQLSDFMQKVRGNRLETIGRVPGTAVYMSSTPDLVPLALMYTTRHHHVLHERVVILTIRTDEAPHVPAAERAWVEPLGNEFWRLAAVYGFMEDPDVPSLLRHVAELEPRLDIDPRQATFFLGQETILAGEAPGGMAEWREHLFSFMARNATKATKFFGLPVDRVVEVGTYIEM